MKRRFPALTVTILALLGLGLWLGAAAATLTVSTDAFTQATCHGSIELCGAD